MVKAWSKRVSAVLTALKPYYLAIVAFVAAVSLTAAAIWARIKLPSWETAIDVLKTLAIVAWLHLFERLFLWKEITDWYSGKLAEVCRPFIGASDCGITKVYMNRKAAIEDILKELPGAKRRLWILGIALINDLNLGEHLETIEDLCGTLEEERRQGVSAAVDQKINHRRDRDSNSGVRILLLDPLCRAAVFRSTVEGDPTKFSYPVGDPKGILDQPLFRKVSQTVDALKPHPAVRSVTRFYSRDPNCWLVIIDDTAYWQPYTLGWNPQEPRPQERSLGPYLPVFRVRKLSTLFETLQDHFKKLWLTSDISYLYHSARVSDEANEVRILKRVILATRRSTAGKGFWVENLHESLYGSPEKSTSHDGRRSPRRSCESNLQSVKVSFGKTELKAKIVDFSEGGILLEVAAPLPLDLPDEVELIVPAEGANEALDAVTRYYRTYCQNKFEVKKDRSVGRRMALKARLSRPERAPA